jgi:hypothetical protein
MTNQHSLLWIKYEVMVKLYLILCGNVTIWSACDNGHFERTDSLHYENNRQKRT